MSLLLRSNQSLSDFVGVVVLLCGACFAPLVMLRLVHFAADSHLAGEMIGTLRSGAQPAMNRLNARQGSRTRVPQRRQMATDYASPAKGGMATVSAGVLVRAVRPAPPPVRSSAAAAAGGPVAAAVVTATQSGGPPGLKRPRMRAAPPVRKMTDAKGAPARRGRAARRRELTDDRRQRQRDDLCVRSPRAACASARHAPLPAPPGRRGCRALALGPAVRVRSRCPVSAAAALGCLLVAFLPVQGRPLVEWVRPLLNYLHGRVTGQGLFLGGPWADARANRRATRPSTAGRRGQRSGARREREERRGRGDSSGSRCTAVLQVTAPAYPLADRSTQQQRVSAWGSLLAQLGQEGSRLAAIQWVERTIPDSGRGFEDWWQSKGDHESPSAGSYEALDRRRRGRRRPGTRRSSWCPSTRDVASARSGGPAEDRTASRRS